MTTTTSERATATIQRPVIHESEIDKAVDFLRDNARAIGEAKGRLIKAQRMIDHIEAILLLKSDQSSDTKRKADARASDRWLAAANEEAMAAAEFEKLRSLREAAAMRIEVWRSEQANYRALKI